MGQKCFVSVSIRGPDLSTSTRDVELGEFHAVWENGIAIGSDPRCTLVLPELAPVAVRVIGASNHKLLYRLPEGTTFPLPPISFPVGRYDERIDYQEFQVGPYGVRFGEVYREDTSNTHQGQTESRKPQAEIPLRKKKWWEIWK